MNNVNLYRCLDSEPELSGVPGRDVCELWFAFGGMREAHKLYVRVIAFMDLALRLVRELSEEDRVVIAGHLRCERWLGQRRLCRHTVFARVVDFVDAQPEAGAGVSAIAIEEFTVPSDCPSAGVCSSTRFCPVGLPRKVAALPSPAVRARAYRGSLFRKQTPPRGADERTR